MPCAENNNTQRLIVEGGWLARTPPDFQAAVIERCTWQRVEPQVSLTDGGTTGSAMVGIITGTFDLISATGPTDTPIVHVARAPFWFGDLSTVGGRIRATAVVTRTICDVVMVPQGAIDAIMAANPAWWKLFGMLSLDFTALMTQTATDLLIADSTRRCAAVLLRIAGCRSQCSGRCSANIGHGELAAMANMSRQTIGTVLRALQAQGLIELGYRSIAIIKPAKLLTLVDV